MNEDAEMRLPLLLDHCVIHVSDWGASNAFYRDVIGAGLVPMGHETTATSALSTTDRLTTRSCISARTMRRIELGPVERPGARGTGLSVYFRDPDGSLLELISYHEGRR